jgi:hypothetical protein
LTDGVRSGVVAVVALIALVERGRSAREQTVTRPRHLRKEAGQSVKKQVRPVRLDS